MASYINALYIKIHDAEELRDSIIAWGITPEYLNQTFYDENGCEFENLAEKALFECCFESVKVLIEFGCKLPIDIVQTFIDCETRKLNNLNEIKKLIEE